MSRRRRNILIIVGLVLAVFAAGALWFYEAVCVPNGKMRDIQWLENASPQERLEVAHQVLSFPVGMHHDAFMLVRDYGDVKSIPYLLKGLRWQPHTDPGYPAMVCTKINCLDALKRITGHDAGLNYEDWAQWWETQGRNLPPEAFPLKPVRSRVPEPDQN